MKFKDVNHALILFEKHNIQKGEAANMGNGKKNNYHYNKIREIVSFLKKEKALIHLSDFFNHANPYVRLSAAANLLPLYEEDCIKIMEDIVNNEKGIVAIDAEYTISEWQNGNLKNFYTL